MSCEQIEEILNADEPLWKITANLDKAFEAPEAGALMWEAYRKESIEPFYEGYWKALAAAEQGSVAPEEALRFFRELGDWLGGDAEAVELTWQFGLKFLGSGNLPCWNESLDQILEKVYSEAEELFAKAWQQIPSTVSIGLAYAVARRGGLDGDDLPDEVVREVVRDLVYNFPTDQAFAEARRIFGDQRLGPFFAEEGGTVGPQISSTKWWELTLGHANTEQLARLVLNIHADASVDAAARFALEHFGEEEFQELTRAVLHGEPHPEGLPRPSCSEIAAAAAVGLKSLEDDRPLSDDDLQVMAKGLLYKSNSADATLRGLMGVPLEQREQLILGLMKKPNFGWTQWSMIHVAPTEAVMRRLFEISAPFSANDPQLASVKKALDRFNEDHRELLMEVIDSTEAIQEDLKNHITKPPGEPAQKSTASAATPRKDPPKPVAKAPSTPVKLLGPDEIDDLLEKPLRGRNIFVSAQLGTPGTPYFISAKLNSRGARAFIYDDYREPPDLVIADATDPIAHQAVQDGVPAVSAAAVRSLIGPPLANLRERLLDRLRVAREMQELVHVHLGEPADAELITRVEEEILGFSMPPALRTLYEEMNGFSLYLPCITDESKCILDPTLPLEIAHQEFVPWNEFAASQTDTLVYPDGYDRARAAADSPDHFYLAVVYIMPLEAMFFDNDWEANRGYQDLYLFDAFDPFYEAALQVDSEAETVMVRMVEDHGASTDDWDPIEVEDYIEQLLFSYFSGREAFRGKRRRSYSREGR